MKLSSKLILALLLFFSTATGAYAQICNTCAFANINGQNCNKRDSLVLPCGDTCTTLTGTYLQTYQTTTYSVAPKAYTPYSYTTGTALSIFQDDVWSQTITLPFNFCYFGNNFNQVKIGTNGLLTFNMAYASGPGCPWSQVGGTPIPSAARPTNTIYGVWHDIFPTSAGAGEIYYTTYGVAPCRVFVVSFAQVPYFTSASCPGLFATHQIALYETTNVIEIYIQNKPSCAAWNEGRALEGIQNGNGTVAYTVPGRNSTVWTATNDAYVFTPTGPSNTFINWFNQAGVSISNTSSVNVCNAPGTTNTYYFRDSIRLCNNTSLVRRDTVIVVVPDIMRLQPPAINDVLCKGDSTGSITVNFTGGIPPYTYTWSPPQANSNSISNLPAGNYTITITDSILCTVSGTYTVNEPPTAVNVDSAQVTNVLCFGDTTGSITAFASGGVGNKTYSWSNGATGATIINLGAGVYTVTALDALGCDDTASYTITEPATPVSIQLDSIVDVLCFGGSNGSVTVTGNGGTGAIHYTWSSPSPADTLQAYTNLTSGTYFVTVTDDNGCSDTASYIVNQPANALQLFNPTITNVSCFGGNDGAIVSNASGGTGTITYLWSNSANTPTINALDTGVYDLTVTDVNGCFDTSSYVVAEPADLVITGVVTDVSCNGGNNGVISLSNSGGTGVPTYAWTQALNSNTYTGAIISGLIADTYTAIATDQNGCKDTTSYTVAEPATAVTINSSSITNVTCFGGNDGSIIITASGGTGVLIYSWTTVANGGYFGDTLTAIPADTFTLNVTDANGCSATGVYVVTQPPLIVLNPIVTGVTCAGDSTGTIDANGSGGTGALNYAWSNGLPPTQTQSNLPGNVYDVTVTDASACQVTASITVNEPAALDIAQPTQVNVDCYGNNTGSLTANVSGGTIPYNYTWTQMSSMGSYAGQTINNLTADTYALLVTDLNGCQDTAAYLLTQPSAPLTLDSAVYNNVTCFGYNNGNIHLYVSGGTPPYQFIWNTDTTYNPLINNLPPGLVNATVRDFNGCSIFSQYNIFEPTQVVISLPTIVNVSCNGGNSGSISIQAFGGTPDTALATGYNYFWSANSGSQTTPTASNLFAGNYTVTVSDALGCFASESYSISEPTPLVANPIVSDVTCFGGNNGSIDANPSGGTPPYQFIWNDSSTTQVITALNANLYSTLITDANGCMLTTSAIISQPSVVIINTVETPVGCPGTATGTLTATITGGSPPYTFSVSPDGSNFIFSPDGFFPALEAGDYVLYVADANSCVRTKNITIPEASPDEFTYTTDSTSCYGNDYQDGAIHINALNVFNMPYEYSVDGGLSQYSGDFYYIGAGIHTITALNRFGCPTEIQVIVEEPLPIVVDVNPDTVTMTPGESAQAIVSYLNATNVSYNWTPFNGLSCSDCFNPIVTVYQPTDFTVEVAMQNGTATCYGYAKLHATVGEPDPVYVPNTFTPNGDGKNDFFLVYGNDIKTVSLRIFNRWGEKVFESNNVFEGWDGTYKGVKVNPDVFTYDVDIELLTGKAVRKSGTVTLLR
jgi:gliding motility-associated-like protein